VCDCYAGGYKCEQTCLEDALVAESVYATVGTVSSVILPGRSWISPDVLDPALTAIELV
jgi:putative lipase involved disintegration of autophagic bodies